jgi:hypothetical protein
MRRLTLLIVILCSTLYAAPDQPVAVAKFCGNFVVHGSSKSKVFERIQAEGCENIQFVHIENGYYLAFGTRVLVAEAVTEEF